MSTNIRERAAGPGARLVGLLATIRVGGPIQARQVLHARQQLHIRLGGVLGRAGIGAIQGVE